MGKNSTKNLISGLCFVGVGVLIILSSLGLLGSFGWFTLILSACLIYLLIVAVLKLNFYQMFFSIAVLFILHQEDLFNLDLSWFSIMLSAFLLATGCNMIFKDQRREKKGYFKNEFASADAENSAEVNFASRILYIIDQEFEVSNLECNFGNLKVYFNEAKMKDKNALVNVEANFSEVTLFVPQDWHVVDQVDTTFGSCKIQLVNTLGDNVLIINGDVTFATLNIRYI